MVKQINPNCQKCALHLTCKTPCMGGEGTTPASIMVVVENPSYHDEDVMGVADSDKDKLLKELLFKFFKIPKQDVYFTHLVKCRTANVTPVTEKDITACYPYLVEEIKAVQPKVILAVGSNVAKALSKQGGAIAGLRNKIHYTDYDGVIVPTICTYSPAYVNYNEQAYKPFAEDLYKAFTVSQGASDTPVVNTQVVQVTTLEQVKEVVGYIKEVGVCAFDFESTGLDWFRYDPTDPNSEFKATLLSISFQVGAAYTIPLEHFESPFTTDQVKSIFRYFDKHVFSNPQIRKIAHNTKFDMHIARVYGVQSFRGRFDDTMVMSHCYDETVKHGLKELGQTYYPKFTGYEDEVKKYNWAKVPLDILSKYGGGDTDLTLRLAIQLETKLLEDERVYKLYRNLQMAFLKPAFEAEHRGMLVDRFALEEKIGKAEALIANVETRLLDNPVVRKFEGIQRTILTNEILANTQAKIKALRDKAQDAYLQKQYTLRDTANEMEATYGTNSPNHLKALKRLEALPKPQDTATITKLVETLSQAKAGELASVYKGFNPASVPQLKQILYTKDGFNFKEPKTEATAQKNLLELPDTSGFIENLILLRSLEKTTSTYLNGILERLDTQDRVHTSFLQHGTKSGRLSSRDPNLQNLPDPNRVKNEEAKQVTAYVKSSFTAPEGYYMVQADFSQAELRIVADYANETNMIQAYADDKDLHAITGAKLANKTLEEFYQLDPKEQKSLRTKAKAANFGLLYGMGLDGFLDYAKNNYGLILTKKEGEQVINDFFSLYPKLKEYHATYVAKGKKFGYVRTLFGRKRHLPDIKSSDNFLRSNDERVAINSPIQGTAGEFTIFSIVLLALRLGNDGKAFIVNTIHDSIILYIKKEHINEVCKLIKKTAENPPTLPYFDRELTHVGMKVDIEYSETSWKDLKPYEIV